MSCQCGLYSTMKEGECSIAEGTMHSPKECSSAVPKWRLRITQLEHELTRVQKRIDDLEHSLTLSQDKARGMEAQLKEAVELLMIARNDGPLRDEEFPGAWKREVNAFLATIARGR